MNGGRVDDEAENVGDRVGVDERGWPVLVCGDGREFSLEKRGDAELLCRQYLEKVHALGR